MSEFPKGDGIVEFWRWLYLDNDVFFMAISADLGDDSDYHQFEISGQEVARLMEELKNMGVGDE